LIFLYKIFSNQIFSTNLFIYGLSVSILIIRSLSIALPPFEGKRLFSLLVFFRSSNVGNALAPCRMTFVAGGGGAAAAKNEKIILINRNKVRKSHLVIYNEERVSIQKIRMIIIFRHIQLA